MTDAERDAMFADMPCYLSEADRQELLSDESCLNEHAVIYIGVLESRAAAAEAEVERLKAAYLQCNETRRRQIASWRNTAKENLAAGQAIKSDLRVAVEALRKWWLDWAGIYPNGWTDELFIRWKGHNIGNIPREFFDTHIAKGGGA